VNYKEAFIQTLREDPAEAQLISHKLMIRSGMIQKVASGIYTYLPLGLRVIKKIEHVIREEMKKVGYAELQMPVVVPAELWQESGRWDFYGAELLRLKDRKNNDFCLGPTHEEVVVDIARKFARSYRDFPVCLYQIQGKFRDEIRPRYGLMRGREFIMKDAYSFHTSETTLDTMYWKMHHAYSNIFQRLGLHFRPVEADSGAIGGNVTHEFHVLADSGEDTIAVCTDCDYAANIERAENARTQEPKDVPDQAPAMELVETPDKKTIEDVAAFMGVKTSQTIKFLIYSVNNGEYFVGVCIRGDMELNEVKLKTVLGAEQVAIPSEQELQDKTGLSVGYLGAVNLPEGTLKTVIADFSIADMDSAVVGANKEGYHYKNAFPGRDLTIDKYVDVNFVAEGDQCVRCSTGTLTLTKGIEVGQVFKLGKKYTSSMNMTFLTEKGDPEVPTMGCYGIGVGRTAAAAIEQNHDKHGILWPTAIAPFHVDILLLDPDNEQAIAIVQDLERSLEAEGYDILVDDRDERPGVKFNDADLIGCPMKVIVGARGLKEGKVEIKARDGSLQEKIEPEKAFSIIHNWLKDQS